MRTQTFVARDDTHNLVSENRCAEMCIMLVRSVSDGSMAFSKLSSSSAWS